MSRLTYIGFSSFSGHETRKGRVSVTGPDILHVQNFIKANLYFLVKLLLNPDQGLSTLRLDGMPTVNQH